MSNKLYSGLLTRYNQAKRFFRQAGQQLKRDYIDPATDAKFWKAIPESMGSWSDQGKRALAAIPAMVANLPSDAINASNSMYNTGAGLVNWVTQRNTVPAVPYVRRVVGGKGSEALLELPGEWGRSADAVNGVDVIGTAASAFPAYAAAAKVSRSVRGVPSAVARTVARTGKRWRAVENYRNNSAWHPIVSVPPNSKAPGGYNINLAKALQDPEFLQQMRASSPGLELDTMLNGLGLSANDYKIAGFMSDYPIVYDPYTQRVRRPHNFALKDGHWIRKQKYNSIEQGKRLTPPPYVPPKAKTITSRWFHDASDDLDARNVSRKYYGGRSGGGQRDIFFSKGAHSDSFGDVEPLYPRDGVVGSPVIVASEKYMNKQPNGSVLITPDVPTFAGDYAVLRPERLREAVSGRTTLKGSDNIIAKSDMLRTREGLELREATRPSGRTIRDASDISDLLVPFKLEGKDKINTMHLVRNGTASGVTDARYVHPVVNQRLGSARFPSILSSRSSRVTPFELLLHNLANPTKQPLRATNNIVKFDVPVN